MVEYLVVHAERTPEMSLGYSLRSGLRSFRDPMGWARFRWLGALWVYGLGSTIAGAAFAVGGSRILVARGPFALYVQVPGGLHLHGAVMLAIGLPILMSLALPLAHYPEPRPLLRRTLGLAACYYWWSTLLLLGAGLAHGGRFSLIGTLAWGMLSGIITVLALSHPPEAVSRVETGIFRAATEAGLQNDKAQEVVLRYLGEHRELG